MNLRILIRAEAREDLSQATAWYEAQDPGLGRRFLAEVRQQLLRIGAGPDAFPGFHRQTRRALIQRFPYGIVYLHQIQAQRVVVLAVLHCGRDPKLWRERSQG